MPRVLVVYGTTEGHTARIAQAIAGTLRSRGLDADVIEGGSHLPAVEYAAVIVAASVHAGRYQRSIREWVRRNAHALNRVPSAFVSVCLAVLDHSPTARQRLVEILDRFYAETGWRPSVTKSVAGALLYTRYSLFTRWIMKRIVRKAGGDTDTSRDYEYTDWNDLRACAEAFARRVNEASPVPGTVAARSPRVA